MIEEEGLVERAAAIGETIRARMLALAGALRRRSATCAGSARCSRSSSSHDRATKEPAPELAQRGHRGGGAARPAAAQVGHLLELHPRARAARRSPTPSSTRRSTSGKTRSSTCSRRVVRGARRREDWSRRDGRRADRGPVRARGARRHGRHVERLPRARHACSSARSRSRSCTSSYSARRGLRRALPARGARGRAALAPEHRHGHRPRRGRRAPVHRLRVRRRREPEAAGRARAGRCRSTRRSSSALEIGRALAFAHEQRARPPRREAAERAPQRRRRARR